MKVLAFYPMEDETRLDVEEHVQILLFVQIVYKNQILRTFSFPL